MNKEKKVKDNQFEFVLWFDFSSKFYSFIWNVSYKKREREIPSTGFSYSK